MMIQASFFFFLSMMSLPVPAVMIWLGAGWQAGLIAWLSELMVFGYLWGFTIGRLNGRFDILTQGRLFPGEIIAPLNVTIGNWIVYKLTDKPLEYSPDLPQLVQDDLSLYLPRDIGLAELAGSDKLIQRRLEVKRMYYKGYTQKQIADELIISIETVKRDYKWLGIDKKT